MFRKIINIFGREGNYKSEFHSAVKRAKKWGLDVPDIKISECPVLTGEKGNDALRAVQDIASRYTAEEVSQQCFWYMHSAKDVLEDVLQMPIYYTLGYIDYEKSPVFYTRAESLKDKLSYPISGVGALNLHAWLTTPSMEIIDLTFFTTYGVVHNMPSAIGRIVFQHCSSFNENMVYHPQLVGEDYLKRIGGIVDLSAAGMFII